MGTKLTEVSNFDSFVLCPNPFEPVRASAGGPGSIFYTLLGVNDNGGVSYTAQITGVRIRHLGGISMTLSVTVSGTDITVQLATDGSGNVTSTANQVVTAYNAVSAAVALATATATGFGGGIAGVYPTFTPLTDDPFGSIRPAIQQLTNRTRFLLDEVYNVVDGTTAIVSQTISGVEDGPATPVPGQSTALVYQTGLTTGVQGGTYNNHQLIWRHTGTGTNDANPPVGTALTNELRAINTCKCWGYVATNGAGAFSAIVGINFAVSIVGGHIFITMLSGMDTADYAVIPSVVQGTFVKPTCSYDIISATQFRLNAQNNFVDVDAGTTVLKMSFQVFGQQTS